MHKPLLLLILVTGLSFRSAAQLSVRPFVRATGQASVFAPPDQVKVDASVVTQGSTAQEAASRNSDQVDVVLAALRKLLGSGADIKTINYAVVPNYKYPQGGGTPTLTGYTASVTVEVTLGAVSMTGPIIDTATQAGATSIGGLRFSLKDPEPQRLQALRLATLQAKSHAEAMASGLGGKVGAVISLEEGAAAFRVQPVVVSTSAAAGTPTPVEPGLIEVQASVVLQAELN
jgi:uncharacterized protein YggE